MELLCCSVYDPSKHSALLDVKFGAPKLNEENVTLTFGIILNLVNIYVKALNMVCRREIAMSCTFNSYYYFCSKIMASMRYPLIHFPLWSSPGTTMMQTSV